MNNGKKKMLFKLEVSLLRMNINAGRFQWKHGSTIFNSSIVSDVYPLFW